MRVTLLTLLAILGVGCGGPPSDPDDYEVVVLGKEDNYRSSNAQEFLAQAEARVTLDASLQQASDTERLDRARELVSAKLLQIGWFLNLYVADKEPEDGNKDYGGFHAMARNASVKALKIDPIDTLTYAFNFEATIGAESNFLEVVPGTPQPDGSKLVELKLAKLSNATLLGSWTSGYDVHGWDPARVDGTQLETLMLTVRPAPRSSNAYLNYTSLYEDGKLSVGIQLGWDYNAERSDLSGAREVYDDLRAAGFSSPVQSFDDLKLDSAPLGRASIVGGKTVQVEVKLVHPGMVASPSDNAVDLRNALLDLLATREVILFSGHAGVSGRLLPADFRSTSAGNIMPAEYATLKLLPTFQLLLVDGCQTYARFTDGFRANPLKKGPKGELVNMDIVTTTSYSWDGTRSIETILFALVGKSATSQVKPVTWDDVLRTLNAPPYDAHFFGVNGIDGDPHGHPYARLDLLGKSCTSTAVCGGEGNLCTRTSQASKKKVCATVCLDDAGCPSTYACATVANGGAISGKACIKRQ